MAQDFVRVPKLDAKHLALVLDDYRDKLTKDLQTKADGHPNWSAEDEEWMSAELVWIAKMQPILYDGENPFDR